MANERVFEMIWDCPACGTKKLLAKTNRACPNCGSPQEPLMRYFPAEGDAVSVANYTYAGSDVVCGHCQTPNSKLANFCINCAAPLQDANAIRTLGTQTRGEGRQFEQEDLKARLRSEKQAAQGSKNPGEKRGPPLVGIVIAIFAVLGLTIWYFGRSKDEVVTVRGHTWEREVQVQRLQATPASAWCEGLPVGAYQISSFSAVRSTRNVPDGQVCRTERSDNGDGTFTQRRKCSTKYRSEPVYDRKCNFTLNTWVNVRTAKTSGAAQTPAPFWPSKALEKPGSCLGCEREGARSEKFEVLLKRPNPENPDFRCPLPFDVWSNIGIGVVIDMKVGQVANEARCETMKFRP